MVEDVREVVALLREFAVASEHFVESTGSRHGLHRTDMHALELMMRAEMAGDTHTAMRLGEELGLTPAATTALVDRLESTGHARRERRPGDRRRIHVVPTESAHADGRLMFGPLAVELAELASSYSDDELAVVKDFLSRATATVRRLTNPGSAG